MYKCNDNRTDTCRYFLSKISPGSGTRLIHENACCYMHKRNKNIIVIIILRLFDSIAFA